MFSKGQREEAIGNMKRVQATYEIEKQGLIKDAKRLLDKRRRLQTIIDEAWDFVNNMSNKSVALNTELKVIKIEAKKFYGLLKTMEMTISNTSHSSSELTAANIVVGRGVASLGPTAVLAIATAIRTVDSGRTIPTRTSTRSTHAELPRHRSGAQTIERKGTTAGNFGTPLLGLANPTGCGAILNTVLLRYRNNKVLAERANMETVKISRYVSTVKATRKDILDILELSARTTDALLGMLLKCRELPADYIQLTTEQKQLVDALVNNTKAGTELLNRVVVDKELIDLLF
ncbi:hypothetical protein [Paenibacillus sp. GCM10012306]|uniref:hypothetical protein n=1 Tax=Paenibacillus sp. GCM10012306 TaxID=3317342 RepID=UPI003607ABE7